MFLTITQTTHSRPYHLSKAPSTRNTRCSATWGDRVLHGLVNKDSPDKTNIYCMDKILKSEGIDRREAIVGTVIVFGTLLLPVTQAFADDFVETSSGLKYLDIKIGTGQEPRNGSKCAIHWSGYTEGYQGKRFGNSTVKDEPFEFVLGRSEAIPAVEEAVAGMKVGGIRRIQIPGIHPEIGYPRDRSERFVTSEANMYKYRRGPQPSDLGGQRALDFVLDNPTLQPFNRDLLIDIKLLRVYG